MSAHVWQSRLGYIVRRIGLPGWLGLLSLAAALVFLVIEVLPGVDSLTRIGERVSNAQTRLAYPVNEGGAVLTPAQQLAAFYRDFPRGAKIPDVLARIHDIADEQKLALELGEYALTKTPGSRLDQFRITLPVKGTYPQVRKFAADTLTAIPALSLESLSLRREKVTEGNVEGRIVFLLFLEHGP